MKKVFVVLSMLLVVLINAVYAQKPSIVTSNEPGWHKIGETSASFKKQNESISVMGADRFDAIKLKVTDAPLNIERLQVFYESGEMKDVDVDSELQPGSTTRVIDIDGDKAISKVAFTYKTMPNYKGDKAHVELHGLKPGSETDQDAYREDNENDTDQANENVDKTTDKIAETSGNAAAGIKDKIYVDKTGPNGETVYINKHDQCYYINDEGKKVYVSKLELKDKVKKSVD